MTESPPAAPLDDVDEGAAVDESDAFSEWSAANDDDADDDDADDDDVDDGGGGGGSMPAAR